MSMRRHKWIWTILSLVIVKVCFIVTYFADYEPKYEIKFRDSLYIHPHDSYYFLTNKEIIVQINSDVATIPAGFDSNLSTIPRSLMPILSPQMPSFLIPAIFHDYLYSCPGNISRRVVDDILYSALISEGMGKANATAIWISVRLFSGNFFNKGFDCNDK